MDVEKDGKVAAGGVVIVVIIILFFKIHLAWFLCNDFVNILNLYLININRLQLWF